MWLEDWLYFGHAKYMTMFVQEFWAQKVGLRYMQLRKQSFELDMGLNLSDQGKLVYVQLLGIS